jgi:hypothetical protein
VAERAELDAREDPSARADVPARAGAPAHRASSASLPSAVIGLQRAAGNRAVARLLAGHQLRGQPRHRTLARRLLSGDWQAYQRRQQELEEFVDQAPYTLADHLPSTRSGCFDAVYWPGTFLATVRLRFYFIDGDPTTWDRGLEDDEARYAQARQQLTWTKAEEKAWKDAYLAAASTTFTSAGWRLWCQEEDWELLSALVKVQFVDYENPAQPEFTRIPHFEVNVIKVPPGREYQSFVIRKSPLPGQAQFNSEGLRYAPKSGGKFRQRSAIHESGHMLGLSDEYQNFPTDPQRTAVDVGHNRLVKKHFGREVKVRDDDRLMSVGDRLVPEYAVVFAEAIAKATGKRWSVHPKPASSIPYDPDRIRDTPPQSDTRVA